MMEAKPEKDEIENTLYSSRSGDVAPAHEPGDPSGNTLCFKMFSVHTFLRLD